MTSLPDTDDLEGRLAALGQGFSWHLTAEEAPRLAAARAVAIGTLGLDGLLSPLLPESAALAVRLFNVAPDEAVIAFDADPALVSLLTTSGAEVRALRGARGAPVAGALEYFIGDPVPAEVAGRADAVVVDTFHFPGRIIPLLGRALGCAREGGRLWVLVHPLQRKAMNAALALLPIEVERRHQECAARLIPGPHLADILWDWWELRATGGEGMVKPDVALTDEALDTFDPAADSHGCLEMVDVMAEGEVGEVASTLRAALLAGLSRARITAVASHAHGADGRAHCAFVLPEGGHLACTFILDDGRISLDVTPWTPRLHIALAAELAARFGRSRESVRV